MKILFLEAGVMASERFVYQCSPPLGLMYLASYLRHQRPEHTLSLFDMMAKRSAPESVDQLLQSFAPDLVAIHAMSLHASFMHAVAARVKAWRPDCVVAVGGPHPSVAAELVVSDANVDVVGVGEGEATFLEIVDRVEQSADLAGIPGTVVLRDAIRRTAAVGLFTQGFFMLGFPGETEEEIRQTIDFAGSLDLHAAAFFLLTPFPGTEVFQMAQSGGKPLEFDYDNTSHTQLTTNLTKCDDATLRRLFKTAHWKFYVNPKRLYRIVRTLPHPTDLFRVGIRHFRLRFLS